MVKNVNMRFFLNIMLCYYFSLEGVLQDMVKSNPTERQIEAETQVILKHAPTWKLTDEKTKSLLLQTGKPDLNYKFSIIFCYC